MTKEQKYVLAAGFLALAIVFTYVPFQSTYNRDGDNSKAYEGYSLLWSPPNPVRVCVKTFGMRVSPSDSPERIVQRANRTCYVSPSFSRIIVSAFATALLTLTVYLLIGVFRGKPAHSPFAPKNSIAPEPFVQTEAPQAQQSLAQLLLSDIGPNFPVSTGNAKEDDPLVITALSDYVSVEYAAVKHVLSMLRETYELDSQSLLTRDGRQIDKLVFKVKEAGAADWTGRRSFYFDITKGFGRLK
mgnify:CR=1 FL=1